MCFPQSSWVSRACPISVARTVTKRQCSLFRVAIFYHLVFVHAGDAFCLFTYMYAEAELCVFTFLGLITLYVLGCHTTDVCVAVRPGVIPVNDG